ncbi:substrate-binding periplasmic protein [Afifella pfennigii]|uniref:substrate-binding periplasmic protein n=1 Tax=Afifella pfennigii TaxID=209897 RepID=UPI000558B3B6|nr:ABC transporter substrate-binding protein [Afifella pfennigii]
MVMKQIAALATAMAMVFATPALADTVTVGVTTTGVPFTFIDTETQVPTGAMVDLAEAIAADNGFEAKFEVVAFSALIPALSSGKIDLISAGMFATEERQKVVDFSTPVYAYGDGMFVSAEDENDYTLEDLKGETIGAQIGTTFADNLQALGIFGEVKLYDSISDIMRDVKLGRIKAGFGDKPIAAYQISQKPELGVRLVENYEPLKSGEVGLAVAKENGELLEKVNASIAKLKESGELDAIFAKYGL